jgi:hypothetical protein
VRHLALYRQEQLRPHPVERRAGLEELFLAALAIGNTRSCPSRRTCGAAWAPIAAGAEPMLDGTTGGCTRSASSIFASSRRAGGPNLMSWCAAVDKTACRAGCCSPVTPHGAPLVLESEEGRGGPLAKDLLVVLGSSDRYAALRRELGIAL